MAGKRVQKSGHGGVKLLGAVLTLSAAAVLLLAGLPRGAAVNSPLEQREPASLAGTPVPVEDFTPAEEPVVPDLPEAPAQTPPETEAGETGRHTMPEEPVEESEPAALSVADTYFDDAVFLGDSRTEGFKLYSGLKTGTYLHATGATVESVFTKSVDTPLGRMPLLDALARVDCGKIYVMLGVNELGWNGTETFRTQTCRLIERVQADHPEAVLVLQSILPVSARQDAKGSYVNNQRILAYNQVLRELAEQYGAVYLNVAEAVADESGCLREDWNFDGVHLNVAGCQAWLEYLRTHPVTEVAPEDLPAEPAAPEPALTDQA